MYPDKRASLLVAAAANLLIACGTSSSEDSASRGAGGDVYNPTTDTWTALAPLPTPVHGVTGAAFLDGIIYMPGGGTAQGGSSGSAVFQVYRPNLLCE